MRLVMFNIANFNDLSRVIQNKVFIIELLLH